MERADADVGKGSAGLLQHRHSLLKAEERLFGRVLEDADHHRVEALAGAGDDVEVAVRHRVERARAQAGRAHESSCSTADTGPRGCRRRKAASRTASLLE